MLATQKKLKLFSTEIQPVKKTNKQVLVGYTDLHIPSPWVQMMV